MRSAQIKDGVVVNYAEVGGFDGTQFIDPMDSVIGSTWDGTSFTHPLPPAPVVPNQVSRRQGLQAIFLEHGMTQDQLEQGIIEHITDPTQQYLALVELRSSQTFERQRPTVVQMGAAFGWDLDALFIKAAALS